jgi:hypothetical protein
MVPLLEIAATRIELLITNSYVVAGAIFTALAIDRPVAVVPEARKKMPHVALASVL